MNYVANYVIRYVIMGIPKVKNINVRKVTKVGGKSLGITFPKYLLSELKWKEKQKVTVKRVHGGLLIKDWKK